MGRGGKGLKLRVIFHGYVRVMVQASVILSLCSRRCGREAVRGRRHDAGGEPALHAGTGAGAGAGADSAPLRRARGGRGRGRS